MFRFISIQLQYCPKFSELIPLDLLAVVAPAVIVVGVGTELILVVLVLLAVSFTLLQY